MADIVTSEGNEAVAGGDGSDETRAARVAVAVSPGPGRLTRSGPLVAFAARPCAPLVAAVDAGREGLARRLAALVTTPGYPPPPFLVIDLLSATAYRFGPLALVPADHPTDATLLAPPSAGPDHLLGPFRIDVSSGLHCRADIAPMPSPDTDLQAGTVPAGGFALVVRPPLEPPVAEPAVEPVPQPVPEPPAHVAAEPAVELAPRAVAMPGEPLLTPAVESAAGLAGEAVETLGSAWDPLADPDVDLTLLGSARRRTAPAASILAAPGLAPATAPSEPIPLSMPPTPPPPPPAPPAAPGRPAPAHEDGGDTTIVSGTHRLLAGLPACLRFDDGTVVEVASGALIGRHRTPAILLPGQQAITVNGDHVADAHWELVVATDSLTVRNLDRAHSTRLRPPGWTAPTAAGDDSPTAVLPGTTVHFGDRWAVVER